MNILLLSMSSFPKGDMVDGKNGTRVRQLQESRFTYDNSKGEKIEEKYYSQLEPITRMLIEEGRQPDEVIMLCTEEAIAKKNIKWGDEEDAISPCEFYESRINEYRSKDIIYTKIPQSLNELKDLEKAGEGTDTIDPNLPESK